MKKVPRSKPEDLSIDLQDFKLALAALLAALTARILLLLTGFLLRILLAALLTALAALLAALIWIVRHRKRLLIAG